MNAIPDPAPKRRVLYIRHRRLVKISDLFRFNQDEWVEAMAELADVTVINEDFDLDKICDEARPDFILYESPPIHAAPLTISNPRAHPEIPRFGFMMQDPHCGSRVHFLRLIDQLNIQFLFTHMTEAALRQSPELKTRVFSVSLLFDDRIFRDYGLPKAFPVSVFGGFLAPEIYKWRAETARKLPDRFPTFIYTHPGYLEPTPRHAFAVTGEDYARILNQSSFSLADTTQLDCLVRKHLEIPASGAVLVAPDSDVLKPYGFKDMENCILGETDILFDKIAEVADDPELYEKIRKNGYDLVHKKYSRKNWRWILDFYELWRNLKPGETIKQQGILGAFTAAPADFPAPAIKAEYPDSPISTQMKDWLQRILQGKIFDVIPQIPSWLFHMTEEWVLLGIIAALKGDLVHAAEFFLAGQSIRNKLTRFDDYDPEEIAWISLIAALTGDDNLLSGAKQKAAGMRHLSLRRVEWLGKILASGGDARNPPPEVMQRAPDDRISIHWTGQLDIKTWLALVTRIFAANGRPGLIKYS